MKYLSIILLAFLLFSCSSEEKKENNNSEPKSDTTAQVIDSIIYNKITFNLKKECVSGVEHKISYEGFFPSPTGNRALDSTLAQLYVERTMGSMTMNDTSNYVGVDSVHEFKPLVKKWGNAFIDGACEAQEGFDLAMGWELDTKNGVTWNKNQVLTVYFQQYSFMGGAHGNGFYNFYNLDLESLEKIKFEDVITDTSKFTALGDQKLRAFLKIDKNTSFIDAGLDVESFPLTSNFGFTKDGLVLFYNSYEIGPYSMGTVELVFKYSEIKDIMNPRYNPNKEEKQPA